MPPGIFLALIIVRWYVLGIHLNGARGRMSKQLKIDFYRIETADGTADLGSLLGQIHAFSREEDKNVDIGDGHIVRIHDYRKWRDLHEANIVRIRMNQVPMRASTSGALNPIALDDDEGVGEQTLLFYHQPTRTVAIQRNRYGVSCSTVAYYARYLGGIYDAEDMQALPVLEPDIIEKMERMTQIKSLDVRVAGIINPKIFGAQVSGYTASAMNKLMDNFKAPTVALSLSVGRRRRDSLSVDHVKEAARSFLGLRRQNEQSVTRLAVKGTDEHGDLEVLNMLRAQMTEYVDIDAKGREIALEERRRAVRKALDRRMVELQQMYK